MDFYDLDGLLTPHEREIRWAARAFAEREIVPIAAMGWETAEFPMQIVPKLAALGWCGGTISGDGCPGLSHVEVGLITMELARGDGSISTFFAITSGLTMGSIALCGSAEQRARWLPPMARMELISAFALTEPSIGSDAAHITTTAKRDGDTYVLNGEKRWIGNATFADVIVVWARDEDTGKVGAFIIEKGTLGFRAEPMLGKTALRMLPNAQIKLENCRVPIANKLVNANSFKDTALVLRSTRFGVAWEAIGHAVAAYDLALDYAKQRQQFGHPIAQFQMIQDKLARMLAEVETLKLMGWRLSKLADDGSMTEGQASLAKMHCCRRAREVVALGREIMGGNGILLEHHLARHFADMEAIYTYEGTNEVNTLIVGREITGYSAFG